MPRLPDDAPRLLYYSFAHRELPYVLLRHGQSFRTAALEGRVAVGIQRLWEGLATDAGSVADAKLIVTSTVHECGGRLVVLITPPRAEHTTEAHFIAVVLDRTDESHMRYVILEFGWDVVTGAPRTVLGEWTKDGTHMNFGDGPENNADAFLAAVCERFTAN